MTKPLTPIEADILVDQCKEAFQKEKPAETIFPEEAPKAEPEEELFQERGRMDEDILRIWKLACIIQRDAGLLLLDRAKDIEDMRYRLRCLAYHTDKLLAGLDASNIPVEYLTVIEAATLLRVTPRSIYAQIKAKTLPAVKAGKSWLISRKSIKM